MNRLDWQELTSEARSRLPDLRPARGLGKKARLDGSQAGTTIHRERRQRRDCNGTHHVNPKHPPCRYRAGFIMLGYSFSVAGPARDVLRFGELDRPRPGPGEVLVQVNMSAVNPTDTKRRTDGRELARLGTIIPNNDGSGTIVEIGDQVAGSRLGERVWVFSAQAGRRYGTGAQFCLVPAQYAVPLPANISFEVGACLGVPAVTAHRALFSDGPIQGHTVVITGGTGRVGRYAVQMALIAGATPIVTVSTEADRADVQALGAEHIVMRQQEDLTERVLEITDGEGVERFVDVAFGPNLHHSPRIIKPNGVLTSYGSDARLHPEFPFNDFMFRNITVRPFSIMGMPEQAKLAAFKDITGYLEADRLNHRISRRFSFEQMVDAHECIEAGQVRGVVLVSVED